MKFSGICPTCSLPFESSKPKRFCTVKCRANAPEFKAIAAANAVKAHAARLGTKAQRDCETCRKPFDCQPKRTKRFCSRGCYRVHLATIFDDEVAAVDQVPILNNFDEFLARDHLDCPLAGCSWSGENLSIHIANTHGIRASSFKRRAGFNVSTGLVGVRLSRRLSERARLLVPFSVRGNGPRRGHARLAAEGLEHYEKAMELRRGRD